MNYQALARFLGERYKALDCVIQDAEALEAP